MPNFELLAPAGDLERVRTALRFGAIYLGSPQIIKRKCARKGTHHAEF